MLSFDTLLTGACQGLIWAFVALGVFISFRLLDFADLSCEGCFTCGAAVSGVLIAGGVPPALSVICAFFAGCIVGIVTGLLHTKLKIPPILAGILTMTALFSVNLMIMQSPNINIGKHNTLYDQVNGLLEIGRRYSALIIGVLLVILVVYALYWFLGTELGCTVRATGDNEKMCRAQGVNTDNAKILGLALSNGLVAVGGSMLCQYQSSANSTMGVGAIVIALASIIIGETIFKRARGFVLRLFGVAIGAVIYRVIVTVIIDANIMSPDNLKLLTALVITVALGLSAILDSAKKAIKHRGSHKKGGA
ncbi:MAG: ABC transporter permease [Clostridia bacterium]|nr:ABC transporter permease [Clostridia bacterium]